MDPTASLWAHCLRHAAKSDVGLRRANNQDSMAVALASGQGEFNERGHLLLVADGMGAHAAGELASKIAADVVPLSYHKLRGMSPPEALVTAIWDANKQIHNRGQASPDFKGMGTTCTVLAILPQGALVGHVGDSRAYRLRGNRIEQLTFDHSLVWEMRHGGQVADEVVNTLVSKNIITRSLGPSPSVKPDLEGPFPIQPGDAFLLCSDGLSGQVPDDEIGAVLSLLPLDEAVDALIHLANLRGGPDNITVVTAQVMGPQVIEGAPAAAPAPAVAKPARPVHPAIWTWLGVSALAALAFMAMGQVIAALVAAGSTLLALVVAMVQRFGENETGFRFDGRPLGRGPHVNVDCTPTPELVGRFAALLQELRGAAAAEKWEVDLARIEGHAARAAAATQAQNPALAAQEYLRGITFVMNQLKSQRRSSDSHIFG